MTLRFRPLCRADFPLLGQWLAAGHVEPWWRERHDPLSIEARYGPAVDGTDPTEVFVVQREGEPVGLVQRYLIDDNPDWKRALAVAGAPQPGVGIDFLIGEETSVGKGLGPAIIGRFLEDTWTRYPHVEVVIVDVDQRNMRSWRALEKCGFRRIWSGTLDSDDPSDEGPCYVYVLPRPR